MIIRLINCGLAVIIGNLQFAIRILAVELLEHVNLELGSFAVLVHVLDDLQRETVLPGDETIAQSNQAPSFMQIRTHSTNPAAFSIKFSLRANVPIMVTMSFNGCCCAIK